MCDMNTAVGTQRAALVRDAFVTLGTLVFAVLAFDDITTDNATDFTVEYLALSACAIWLLVLGVRFIRQHGPARRWTGDRPKPRSAHYLATMAVFGWTSRLAVSIGRRRAPSHRRASLRSRAASGRCRRKLTVGQFDRLASLERFSLAVLECHGDTPLWLRCPRPFS